MTTLTTVDVEVPTDRLPSVNGAEARVAAVAKLLPSAPPVHFHPGGEMDVQISDEVSEELALGDVIAVPPGVGEPRPFEIIDAPRDGWVRVRPARDPHTPATEHAEEHARHADFQHRQRLAENARLDQAQSELQRGLEALRAAGFHRVADLAQRSGGFEDSLGSRLRSDVEAMREREAEAAAS